MKTFWIILGNLLGSSLITTLLVLGIQSSYWYQSKQAYYQKRLRDIDDYDRYSCKKYEIYPNILQKILEIQHNLIKYLSIHKSNTDYCRWTQEEIEKYIDSLSLHDAVKREIKSSFKYDDSNNKKSSVDLLLYWENELELSKVIISITDINKYFKHSRIFLEVKIENKTNRVLGSINDMAKLLIRKDMISKYSTKREEDYSKLEEIEKQLDDNKKLLSSMIDDLLEVYRENLIPEIILKENKKK